MSDPIDLDFSHLAYVAPDRVSTVEAALTDLRAAEARLDLRIAFAEGWKLRFPTRPPAPTGATLQQLVRTARDRLRDDRVASDTLELGARKQIVGLVKAGITS